MSESPPRRFGFGRLGANTVAGTVGLVVRAALQAAYLLALTRALGAAGYGVFAGSIAIATISAALSGWGINSLMLEHVAKDAASAGSLWATALIRTVATGLVLSVVVFIVADATLTDAPGRAALAMFVVSELVAVPLSQCAQTLQLARERGASAAVIAASIPAARLVGLIALLAVAGGAATLDDVARLHLAGSLAGALASFAIVRADGIRAAWDRRVDELQTARLGTRYALGALVAAAYTEVDKVLALQLAGAESAGYYTAAFRIVVVLSLPVWALNNAALPRLFAAQSEQARARVLRPVVATAFAYGVAAAIVGAVGSSYVGVLFGHQFADAGSAMLVLSLWLPLLAIRQCGAFALMSSGRQTLRVGLELGGLALLVSCDLLLLPRLGGVGAAWALVGTEIVVGAACWIAYLRR